MSSLHWLVYGGNGWIGSLAIGYIKELYPTHHITIAKSRADDKNSVLQELKEVVPDRVLSFIGRTYGPSHNTIDYLEQKGTLPINLRDNLIGPLNLLLCCKELNIHLTYLGTGCIFEYDKYHCNPSEQKDTVLGFTEQDKPNFFGSNYSIIKGVTDTLFKDYGTTALNVRIRMPITADLKNKRNFITKILNYEKICSVENSMTVLPDLLPILLRMAISGKTGTVNLTNPGTISHNRILELYQEILNPDFSWKNFSIEEQNQVLSASRSNNFLDTKVLEQFCNVPHIEESIKNLFYSLKE